MTVVVEVCKALDEGKPRVLVITTLDKVVGALEVAEEVREAEDKCETKVLVVPVEKVVWLLEVVEGVCETRSFAV